MSITRALVLLRRLRSPPPSPFASATAAAAAAASTKRTVSSYPSNTLGLTSNHSHSGFAWRKHRWNWMLGIFLSGQTVYFFGTNENHVYADDASGDELVTQNKQGEASVTGLRRIEDGSVISNMHTAKWRIYTDNGRDLFLKARKTFLLLGKLDEAEKYFQAALQEAKEGFGPKDPHVASSCNNMAELYRVRKAFEKAEPLYLEAVSILEDSFGPDDIRVGAALHNLGQFYIAQRKLEQARNCYERALKIKGRVLGHGHPDYAETMFHLGTVLHLQGKEKEAVDLIQESIRILEEAGLRESATSIRRMKYLSQILVNTNRLAEAENLQRKILHILEISKGWGSLDTVIAAEGLALTLQSLGNLAEAQELLERCLTAKQKILPKDHIQISANLLHLARIRLLNSNHLRKAKISEVGTELYQAKSLLDNAIRIAKVNVSLQYEQQENFQSNHTLAVSEKDRNAAIIILLQSLDAIGLWHVRKQELLDAGEKHEDPFEVEFALRECISLFKEPNTRTTLLGASDVKAEYLSCLKHLVSLISTSKHKLQSSGVLDELIDEAKHIQAELSPRRH